MIDELLSIIADKNHWKEENHLKENFSTLIKSIFLDISPSDDCGKNKNDQAENFSQDITGDGNIFSGSGNVSVENITLPLMLPERKHSQRAQLLPHLPLSSEYSSVFPICRRTIWSVPNTLTNYALPCFPIKLRPIISAYRAWAASASLFLRQR